MLVKLKQISFITVLVLGLGATAHGGWKQTDYNSKLISKAEKSLHKKLSRIWQAHAEDEVLRKELHADAVFAQEVTLADAYSTLLHFALNSPDSHRYLSRVKAHLPERQWRSFKAASVRIKRLKKSKEYVIADSIMYEAEKLATFEVRLAHKSYKPSPVLTASIKARSTRKAD